MSSGPVKFKFSFKRGATTLNILYLNPRRTQLSPETSTVIYLIELQTTIHNYKKNHTLNKYTVTVMWHWGHNATLRCGQFTKSVSY